MKTYTDYRIAFVGHWSHVDIFSKAVTFDQCNTYIHKLLNSIRQRDLQYLARVKESFIMLTQAKQVDLLIFFIPVAANTLKATGPIGKSMCTHRNDSLLDRNEFSVHKDYFCIHRVCGK